MLKLRQPTVTHCLKAGRWRENVPETLRTVHLSSDDRQVAFYENVVLNCEDHEYFAIDNEGTLVGFGGLTYIDRTNRNAEISLIINPDLRGRGNGYACAEMIYDHAFNKMNLKTVYGECYLCNPCTSFWQNLCKKYNGYTTKLPNTKYWNGEYYDSMYFSIDEKGFRDAVE
jgi:hypothetical protein